MANTVNDVMNVIASPDYGIKNIAGTNQEILAILQGTHNSKNNIYNLVNDIKNLLQEMVNVSTKKKPVEIKGNLTKINNRHIQDILDETKGIRKSIDNLSKSIGKNGKGSMPTVAKLSDKASEKVANAMIKSMDKQNKGGRLSAIIDSFKKLKDISLKDFILGKQKMKILTTIFKDVEKDLKVNKKDLDNVIKLVNSAPEIINALKKIGWKINSIIKNKTIKKLKDILVGEKNSILSISILLQKNKKNINNGAKVAKKITALVGNLLLTSIFLTIAAMTGGPALLGAKLLSKMINKTLPIAKKLSKNNKHINKAVSSALVLAAFTGLMAVSSLFLSTITVTGVPALLGSVLIFGIVKLNIFTCKIISKSIETIVIGSIGMAVMSTSLILFGIALGKITNATKGVDFKQVGVIAALTVSLALAVAGIGFLITPIVIGSIAVGAMSIALHKFAKAIKTISDTGTVPTKLVHQTLNALKEVGKFFRKNSLNFKALINARRYKRMLKPFGRTISYLTKLKDLGVLPMKLVHQTLNAMSIIANYYKDNPIRRKVIRQARRYKRMLRPFGRTISYLAKLKDLGVLPMKLVHQTLNAMSIIANHYKENPIRRKVVRHARRYKRMLRHFDKTIEYLSKLKELSAIPTNTVKSSLISMKYIMWFYNEAEICDDIELKTETTKIAVNSFADISRDLHNKLSEIKEISPKTIFKSIFSMQLIIHFIKWNSFNIWEKRRAKRTISILKDITSIMSDLSNINSSQLLSVGESLSNTLSGIETIDISKVQAVTDMFNAFNGINKSESAINKFTESVKEFTTTCKNLIDAMGDNTNAINNIDGISVNEYSTKEILDNNISENSSNGNGNVSKSGIQILNVEEIAKTIAEKINGALYVDIPDTQVQLLINGVGGNEWTISRY